MSDSATSFKPGIGASSRLILAASLGNALEFYEILVYGYFAVTVSKAFFPSTDETVSLLVTLGTFGVAFLARPVGAIFLGAYGDRKGRKNALALSIMLMTIGTAAMTVMPTYGMIGIAAPILVLIARLLQGFSVGGEFASSTTFLVEHRPDRPAFFASWQWASQGLAALIATSFGILLTTTMSPADLNSWGWRIPFAFGLLVGPVGWYIRAHMPETPAFIEARAASNPVADVVVRQWDKLLLAVFAVVLSTTSQYILVYMPTYAIRSLGLSQSFGFIAAMLAALLQTVAVPLFGILADRIGQCRIMIVAAILFILTAYTAFALAVAHPSLAMLTAVVCWFSLLKSAYSGALPSLLTDVFPARTRVTGLALAYNIAVPVFGGFAPFAAESLIKITGNPLSPSYYVIGGAILSLIAILLLRRRSGIR